jgi:Rap1a immunity proteins
VRVIVGWGTQAGGLTPECYGYIIGVADVFDSQNASGVCMPKEAVARQVIDVVKKYLTEHPETRDYTAASEVQVALQEAFPCKTPSPG